MNLQSLPLKKAALPVLLASLFLVSAGPAHEVAPPPPRTGTAPSVVFDGDGAYVPGEILVKFRPTAAMAARAAALFSFNSRAVDRIPSLEVYRVRIPDGASVQETAAALAENPAVLFAEPNYIGHASATPNDNLFKYQYALSNTGQAIGDVPGSPQGKAGADIKATQGWEETVGDAFVTIAVLDSGVDMAHPDLVNKVDGPGKDFVNDDLDATDDYYHGTAVAGIAAAQADNNEGIAGVAWNARILPVKVLDSNGVGSADRVANGIRWAAEQGAQVINLSLGFDDMSLTLQTAVQYAFDRGCVLVAAVGNDSGLVEYPAAFSPYVLGVAATDYNDLVWSVSNTGSDVDVAAPGVDILSTVPTWFFGSSGLPYSRVNGTSMAVAHVSGLAAILLSQKPWLTPEQVMEIIRFTSDDINGESLPGKDAILGYGRINMEKALVPRRLVKIEK